MSIDTIQSEYVFSLRKKRVYKKTDFEIKFEIGL